MSTKISHCFHWYLMPKKIMGHVLREFVDNGARSFVFCSKLAKRILFEEADLEDHLWNLCKSMDVEFVAMHGQCGRYHDLNIPDTEERKQMIADHIRAMELAAKFGSRTYTVHVGAMFHCSCHMDLPTLRDLAKRSLEILLPEAEKRGIVLAVENSFEPPNAAREVVELVKPFLSSSHIGYCYDSGHANCMRTAPGKTIENYTPYFRTAWWETGIIQEDNALELMRDRVVTCHLHDNNGYGDLYALPGDGTVEWATLLPALKSCPNMLEFQSEVDCLGGTGYAGTSPAPEGGYSVKRLTECFRNLGFDC